MMRISDLHIKDNDRHLIIVGGGSAAFAAAVHAALVGISRNSGAVRDKGVNEYYQHRSLEEKA